MEDSMETMRPREQKILEFMKDEIRKKGYPPTVREICAALGIKSTSTTHKDIDRLVQKGYIKKDPAKPRALMVTGPGNAGLRGAQEVEEVPLVGRIAAGSPILAEENIEENFPVPAAYLKGTNFMLRVQGESMIEAGILDGDLILVRQQETADNGDIVVAMLEGLEAEATVKKFFREDGHVRLQPENPSMEPIIVDDVSILGLVKGVFRYLS